VIVNHMRFSRCVGLGFLVGALPVAALVVWVNSGGLEHVYNIEAIVSASLAALWGLVGGLVRKSLLSVIVGLNSGALIGYFFGATAPFLVSGWSMLGLYVTCGAALSSALHVTFGGWQAALRGVVHGGFSFLISGLSVAFLAELFIPDLIGLCLMIGVPLPLGLGLFYWFMSEKNDERINANHNDDPPSFEGVERPKRL
jgi:hypothetical protein